MLCKLSSKEIASMKAKVSPKFIGLDAVIFYSSYGEVSKLQRQLLCRFAARSSHQLGSLKLPCCFWKMLDETREWLRFIIVELNIVAFSANFACSLMVAACVVLYVRC